MLSGMALHNRDFAHTRMRQRSERRFIYNVAAEGVADGLGRALIPIVAVTTLDAGTGLVGMLNSLSLAAFLFLSSPLGAKADRIGSPLSFMSTGTLLRAGIAGVLGLAGLANLMLGNAGFIFLTVATLLISIFDVVYTTGQGLLVPRLVGQERVRQMMGRAQTAAQGAGFLSPLLLSIALLHFAPQNLWWLVCIAYLTSLLFQRGIDAPNIETVEAGKRTRMVQGYAVIFQHPVLRNITLANLLNNAAVMAANTLLPVIALNTLGLSPAAYAGLGAVGALSGVAGAASASSLTSRFGLRKIRVSAALLLALSIALVLNAGVVTSLLPGPSILWIGINSGVAGLCTAVAMVAGSDLPPAFAPPEQLGATLGAMRTITLGIMPFAALAAGAIGTWWGIKWACLTWLLLALLATVPCLRLPRRAISLAN